jgi:hypothetical protein
LAVNRSEGDATPLDGGEPDRDFAIKLGRRRRRDDIEFNELDLKIRVSYKTLLLVFVLFDVAHKVVSTLSDSEFVQGLIP